MVQFGELVIPSSRALWDDEEYEQFENDGQTIQWDKEIDIPAKINNLLIVETKNLTSLARSGLKKSSKPVCSLTEQSVSIFKLKNNDYLILCDEGKDVIPGEIVEKLIPWLENAKKITALTRNSAAHFLKNTQEELSSSFIRTLYTGNVGKVHAPLLESPNLTTGISAGVLSYCHHSGLSAALYICYQDSHIFDSKTATPVLNLIEKLQISSEKPFSFVPIFHIDSNLYM